MHRVVGLGRKHYAHARRRKSKLNLILEKSQGVRQTFSLASLTAIATVLNLAFSIVTAREMGPTGRGIVAIALTIGTTTSLAFSCGINTAARYYLPRRNAPVTLGDYLGLGMVLTVVQVVISVIITSLLLGGSGRYGSSAVVGLITLYSGLSMLSYLALDMVNAYGKLQISQVISALGSFVQLAFVEIEALTHTLTVRSALVGLSAGIFVQVVGSILVTVVIGKSMRPKIRLGSAHSF